MTMRSLYCAIGAIVPLCSLLHTFCLEAKEPKTIVEFAVVLDCLPLILAAAEKIGELEKVSYHARKCYLDCTEAPKYSTTTYAPPSHT
jgi:importin subunit alpha-2